MLTQSWGAYRARAYGSFADQRTELQVPVQSSQPDEAELVLSLGRIVAEAETKLALAISVARSRGIPVGECHTVAEAREAVLNQRAALSAVRTEQAAPQTRSNSLPTAGRIALNGTAAATIALYRKVQNAA